MFFKKKFKFSANLDELRMTYVGLSATSDRSMMPVSSGVYISVVTLLKINLRTMGTTLKLKT